MSREEPADLSGRTALVTGASRGLGRVMARALAREGVALALAARTLPALEELAAELRAGGTTAVAIPADLTAAEDLRDLALRAGEELDGVDVLVNNAGVIEASRYHAQDPDGIRRGVAVNLLAPMLLARELLPGMVERGWGHVVNVSSLAGKAGPPYVAVYGATKSGLIGFTQSLRREYHGTGVSASVVCPGYVTGAGMYADAREETGVEAPGRAGRTTPEEVAAAVVRSVREDVPEIVVNSSPVRPLLALTEASPRLGEWIGRKLDLFRSFEDEIRAREGERGESTSEVS